MATYLLAVSQGEVRPGLTVHVDNIKQLAEDEVGEIFAATGATTLSLCDAPILDIIVHLQLC